MLSYYLTIPSSGADTFILSFDYLSNSMNIVFLLYFVLISIFFIYFLVPNGGSAGSVQVAFYNASYNDYDGVGFANAIKSYVTPVSVISVMCFFFFVLFFFDLNCSRYQIPTGNGQALCINYIVPSPPPT
jgi:hypothetical protein